jgi:immune inhibitor A
MKWRDGTLVRERIQAFDSTFGRKGVPSLRLHKASSGTTWKSQKGNPVFDDHKGTYWYASNPTAGVKVRDTNTRITVLHESKKGDRMELLVSPSRK